MRAVDDRLSLCQAVQELRAELQVPVLRRASEGTRGGLN